MSPERRRYDGNGWSEYQKLVLYRLDKIDERLDKLEAGLAGLKLKAAGWGAGMALAAWIGSAVLPRLVSKILGV